ncbi:MAG: acetylornithine deacetylase/succinyl-diaminopimelate desuccinylase-like protein [Gammaproteobacteria bacterium]|jgi:acetylornithine deacetylase/succinyl-diaminopimelate desuccinylase-like protein
MTRDAAIGTALSYFDDGDFLRDLARRVAIRSESQNPEAGDEINRYLSDEMMPTLSELGFECHIMDNPLPGCWPMLLAERVEGENLPTILSYGHGDVILGRPEEWRDGLDPWTVQREGDRLYGRGTADNKGQHSVNLGALNAVLKTRGRLGFNCRYLIEMGEETGSPGLREFCQQNRSMLNADVLIASDGPRSSVERPTLFLGARGAFNFHMDVELREGGQHSGNWGGLLANPGIILAHAIASITSASGKILIPQLLPPGIPVSVREALADIDHDGGEDSPAIDEDWGEPGLSIAEKVHAWNCFEVLAFRTGNPEHPVNAIPPRARATCQIRYTVGVDPSQFIDILRKHLDAHGFSMVTLSQARATFANATRLDPSHPWAKFCDASLARSTNKKTAVLPSLGGTLPNDVFADDLGLPTVWVPHSYTGCNQHAPNEHMLVPVAREALRLMAGLFWDLGEPGTPKPG